MSKFAQEVFEMIVELQGWLPSTSILILGLPVKRYKLASRACRQSVHSPNLSFWPGPDRGHVRVLG
jgi:hypothetical protein